MSDLIADNVVMMLMCSDPKKKVEDMNELFINKLQLALQARWGKQIEYDKSSQIFEFSIKDEQVFIAFDPDSENGITVDASAEISQQINEIASRLYKFSRPLSLPN